MNEIMDPLDIDQDHGHGDEGDETIYSCTRCRSDWFETSDSIVHEASCRYAKQPILIIIDPRTGLPHPPKDKKPPTMNDDQQSAFRLFLAALGINQYANERVLRAAMCAAWEEGFEEGERSTPARANPYKEKT